MRDCCWVPSHGKKESWRAPGHQTLLMLERQSVHCCQHGSKNALERVGERQRLVTAERFALEALERMRDGSDALLWHLEHCSGNGDSDEKMVDTSSRDLSVDPRHFIEAPPVPQATFFSSLHFTQQSRFALVVAFQRVASLSKDSIFLFRLTLRELLFFGDSVFGELSPAGDPFRWCCFPSLH